MSNPGNGLGVYSRNTSIQPSTWNGGGGGTQGSGTTFANYGDTVLVVGKIKWGDLAGDVETLTIWTPDEASLPVNEAGLGSGFSMTMAGVTQTAFDTISMQQRNSGSAQIYDEIRFGAALADVIPVDTVAPTLLSITDDQGGGPIYEDVAVVTYTLTFDRGMDISTITAADFVNAGSATATVGTVTQASGSVIKVQLLPTTTGTLKLRIPATSELKSLAGLDLDTTSNIDDDTTITIQAGTTPLPAFRLWDGSITTGPTDGTSNGGTGTWDISTTNWDYTPGLADPVAWNNLNLDTAILGGAAGTISLGVPITAGGLTSSADYTIQGANTLTLDVSSGIPVVNVTSGTLTINSVVGGSDGLQKDGGATLRLLGTNTFSGGLTLNSGTLVVNNDSSVFGSGTLTIGGGQIRANANGQVSTTGNNHIWNGNFSLSRGVTGSATWNFDGNVTMGANITVTHADNTVTTVLNGNIGDGGNNRILTLAGSSGNFTLAGANNHGGGTTLSAGTLRINNASALGTGLFTISSGTIDNTSGGPITLSTNNTQAWNANITFTGSNDLNMGTGAVTINANRTVTITAGTLTVGGGIGQSGGTRTLTKNGDGTLVLKGGNTYAGNTTVSAGELALVGGSQTSAIITVNSGAFMGFTPGSPTTSSGALNLQTGHKVRINGTPVPPTSYTLITAASIGGTASSPDLETPITDYALVSDGTSLMLNYTGGGTTYATWIGGFTLTDTTFNGDDDGDNLGNGIEGFFGTDPSVSNAGIDRGRQERQHGDLHPPQSRRGRRPHRRDRLLRVVARHGDLVCRRRRGRPGCHDGHDRGDSGQSGSPTSPRWSPPSPAPFRRNCSSAWWRLRP